MVRVPGATAKFFTHACDELAGPGALAVLVDRPQVGLEVLGQRLRVCERRSVSAYSSMKKSNGLITFRSAIRPTVMVSCGARFGNTSRARKLPNASCCQLTKWSAGSTCSE